MKQDKRLQALAQYVPAGCVLADIGTDHGYLPAALLHEGRIKYAIATDVAINPCRMASNTLAMHGLSAVSEVRQGNGLQVLKPGECHCVVMAGMGGTTIADLLENDVVKSHSFSKFIFQPMQAQHKLRQYLCQHGFNLVAEDLISDGKYLYEIIVAEPGMGMEFPLWEYVIGPLLLRENHLLLKLKLGYEISHYKKIKKGLIQGNVYGDKFDDVSAILDKLEMVYNDRFAKHN